MQIFNYNDLVINKKYKISHQINKGSFGLIFKGKDLETDLDIAIKIEPNLLSKKYLVKEARILHLLQKNHHIPRIHWCGSKPNSTFLVMELLGKNLEDLFIECNKKFSLKTVLMMADQMLSNLEFIHSKGYVHSDINPRNICVGLDDKASTFYSIDFGLSNSFREMTNNDNLKDNHPFVGTLNFASINCHKGFEQTCLDDLESLLYVIIYFLTGKLPWEAIVNEKGDLKKKMEEVKREKINTTIDNLCADLPEELKECLEYIRNLEFYNKPDYKFLKKKCEKLYLKRFGSYDYNYDWTGNDINGKEQVFLENKERLVLRHNKKAKCRLIKEELNCNNENNHISVFDLEQKYEEEKTCDVKSKKNEEENTRRKNVFPFVPDQIYHIKKKVKIDNAINIMEKNTPLEIKEVKLPEKKEEETKGKTNENEEIKQKNLKNEQGEEHKEDIKKNEIKTNIFIHKTSFQEVPENEELKSTIKEKFDLLFGNEEEEKKKKEKGYCLVF